mgnify:CR=1 FL=1
MGFMEAQALKRGDMVLLGHKPLKVLAKRSLRHGKNSGRHGGEILLTDYNWHGWWEIGRMEGMEN